MALHNMKKTYSYFIRKKQHIFVCINVTNLFRVSSINIFFYRTELNMSPRQIKNGYWKKNYMIGLLSLNKKKISNINQDLVNCLQCAVNNFLHISIDYAVLFLFDFTIKPKHLYHNCHLMTIIFNDGLTQSSVCVQMCALLWQPVELNRKCNDMSTGRMRHRELFNSNKPIHTVMCELVPASLDGELRCGHWIEKQV